MTVRFLLILLFILSQVMTLLPIRAAASEQNSQTIEIEVESAIRNAEPGIYWYQEDDRTFTADYSDETGPRSVNVPPVGPYPNERPMFTAMYTYSMMLSLFHLSVQL